MKGATCRTRHLKDASAVHFEKLVHLKKPASQSHTHKPATGKAGGRATARSHDALRTIVQKLLLDLASL